MLGPLAALVAVHSLDFDPTLLCHARILHMKLARDSVPYRRKSDGHCRCRSPLHIRCISSPLMAPKLASLTGEKSTKSDGLVAGRSSPSYKTPKSVAFSLHNQPRTPPNTPDNRDLGYRYVIENTGDTWRESDYETVALAT
jgi:hypothetical protein